MDILFNPGMGGYLRHLHLGWGGSKKDPHLTQKLRGLERQEKNNRKLIKNSVETVCHFLLWSKLWPPGAKNVENFEFFAIVKYRVGKPQLSQELLELKQIRIQHLKEN